MPADVVIDHSEPSGNGEDYLVNGRPRKGFTDGVLHDYVDILYVAGDKESARKLAKTLAGQYESIFEYFEKSDARIASAPHNVKDLYAALESYFVVYGAVSNEDSGSALDTRMYNTLNKMYSTTLPKMLRDLRDAAEDGNETVSRGSLNAGKYATRMFEIEDFTNGIAYRVGFLEIPQEPQPAPRTTNRPAGGNQPLPGGSAPATSDGPANGQEANQPEAGSVQ
jgi:hypothetical protein